MTITEAHNLVTIICNTAVQRGFFAKTGDVVEVHQALELLKPSESKPSDQMPT